MPESPSIEPTATSLQAQILERLQIVSAAASAGGLAGIALSEKIAANLFIASLAFCVALPAAVVAILARKALEAINGGHKICDNPFNVAEMVSISAVAMGYFFLAAQVSYWHSAALLGTALAAAVMLNKLIDAADVDRAKRRAKAAEDALAFDAALSASLPEPRSMS